MLRHAVPAFLLLLIIASVGAGHLDGGIDKDVHHIDDAVLGDSLGIGLLADDPARDRLIAGVAVIVLVGSIFVAIYYIARKEGL